MPRHILKTVQPFFSQVESGRKTADLRKNDRNYQVGDILVLEEYDAERFTSSDPIIVEVTCVTQTEHLKKGCVMLSFKKCESPAECFARDISRLHKLIPDDNPKVYKEVLSHLNIVLEGIMYAALNRRDIEFTRRFLFVYDESQDLLIETLHKLGFYTSSVPIGRSASITVRISERAKDAPG